MFRYHTQITIVQHVESKLEEPNVHVILPNVSVLDLRKIPFTEINSLRNGVFHIKKLYDFTTEFYRVPVIMDLYKRKDEFNVILVDFFFNEVSAEHHLHSVIA